MLDCTTTFLIVFAFTIGVLCGIHYAKTNEDNRKD